MAIRTHIAWLSQSQMPSALPRAPSNEVSVARACGIVFGIVVAYATFCWFLIVASPFEPFTLAVSVAIAWCIWLEKHSGDPMIAFMSKG